MAAKLAKAEERNSNFGKISLGCFRFGQVKTVRLFAATKLFKACEVLTTCIEILVHKDRYDNILMATKSKSLREH